MQRCLQPVKNAEEEEETIDWYVYIHLSTVFLLRKYIDNSDSRPISRSITFPSGIIVVL